LEHGDRGPHGPERVALAPAAAHGRAGLRRVRAVALPGYRGRGQAVDQGDRRRAQADRGRDVRGMRADGEADQGGPARGTAVGALLDRGGAGTRAPRHAAVSRGSDQAGGRRSGSLRSVPAWAVLLVVTALGLVSDLASKTVAFNAIAGRPVQ